jgi:hypothetical protein
MCAANPDSGRLRLECVFPKLGEKATSAEIIGFLDRRPCGADHAAGRP